MTPLRTIDLAGFPLRIYASPLDGPDHPWASLDDLAALADVEPLTENWLNHMRITVPDMLHEVIGHPKLVAEPLVTGLFHSWIIIGAAHAQCLLDQWTAAWVELFAVQYAYLSRDEFQKVIRQAGLRNMPNVPGTTVMQ